VAGKIKRKRKDVRNGYRSRDFGAIYGVIEDIKIPRARNSSFTTWILPHFKRRTQNWSPYLADILKGSQYPAHQ